MTERREAGGGPLGATERALMVMRALAGAVLLAFPERVLGDLPARRVERPAVIFTRVLGLRHLIEAAVLWRHHSHRWLQLGAAVDLIHAATMVVLAVVRPRERTLASINAVTAASLGAAGITHDRSGSTPPPEVRG